MDHQGLGHWGYGHFPDWSSTGAIKSIIVSGMAKVLPCIAGKSAQKVDTILQLSYQPLLVKSSYFQMKMQFL